MQRDRQPAFPKQGERGLIDRIEDDGGVRHDPERADLVSGGQLPAHLNGQPQCRDQPANEHVPDKPRPPP